jgi:molecular chaperone DnaJ
VVARSSKLTVNVPAGVDDGQTLRLAGKGEGARGGGQPGHLYVTLSVAPDPRFVRDGEDVLTEVPVSYVMAALGGQVEVPTLEDQCEGTATVEVAPGSQPGDVLVRRGKGVARVGGRGSGDHVVRFRVEIPKKMTAGERDLLKQIAEERGEAVGEGKGATKGGRLLGRLRR